MNEQLYPVSENVEGLTVRGDARAQWLRARRDLITASDAAAILGYDPRRTPMSVYAEKLGALSDEEEDWMAWGRDVEGAIAKGYARKTGRPVFDLGAFEIQRHPDLPWLGATLDRVTEGTAEMPSPAEGRGPLELKAVGGRSVAEWKEEPPVHFVIQVQIQMACTRAQWGALGALFFGLQIEPRDVERNDTFLRLALPRLEEFHWHVQRREPPTEIDGKPATTAALKALYGGESGETVELGDEALALAEQWEAACLRKKDFDGQADEIENRLRALIGAASFAALPDGTLLSLNVTKVKGSVRTVKPHTYRRLRRDRGTRFQRRSR